MSFEPFKFVRQNVNIRVEPDCALPLAMANHSRRACFLVFISSWCIRNCQGQLPGIHFVTKLILRDETNLRLLLRQIVTEELWNWIYFLCSCIRILLRFSFKGDDLLYYSGEPLAFLMFQETSLDFIAHRLYSCNPLPIKYIFGRSEFSYFFFLASKSRSFQVPCPRW